MNRRPADNATAACVLCFGTVAVAERGAHTQEHRDPSGACIRLLWHAGCSERCGWLQRLADNEGPGVPAETSAEVFEALHHELHARLRAEGGAMLLRAAVHVARDLPAPLTLRGPGERWGVATRRMRHPRRR